MPSNTPLFDKMMGLPWEVVKETLNFPVDWEESQVWARLSQLREAHQEPVKKEIQPEKLTEQEVYERLSSSARR